LGDKFELFTINRANAIGGISTEVVVSARSKIEQLAGERACSGAISGMETIDSGLGNGAIAYATTYNREASIIRDGTTGNGRSGSYLGGRASGEDGKAGSGGEGQLLTVGHPCPILGIGTDIIDSAGLKLGHID
jgi:hypothetical protein